MKYSILIGVQTYLDPDLHKLPYVKNDINELSKALQKLGYDSSNTLILQDPYTTQNIIEFKLGEFSEKLNKDDELFFYYAGHGFGDSDQNYLGCSDTLIVNYKKSAISIQMVYKLLKDKCDHIFFFFDSCHSGLMTKEQRGFCSYPFNNKEFLELIKTQPHWIAFSSCMAHETSFEYDNYKHGIWSYYLIKCLNGEVKEILENNYYLTVNNLQSYLYNNVKQDVKKIYGKDQNPWINNDTAGNGAILIADFTDIFTKIYSSDINLDNVGFLGQDVNSCRTLNEWNSKFTFCTPDFFYEKSEYERNSFKDEIYQLFLDLGYETNNINTDNVDSYNYFDLINTDNFLNITTRMYLSDEDEMQYIKEIYLKCDEIILHDDEFNKCLEDYFDEIEYSFEKKINIESLVNFLNKLKISNDYKRSEKTIMIDDSRISNFDIIIKENKMNIKNYKNIQPIILFNELIKIIKEINQKGFLIK